MMVSLVKGLERGISPEEGIFSNGAKDLLYKEKTIFRKVRVSFFSSPWPDSLHLIWHSGQSLSCSSQNICRLEPPFRFDSEYFLKMRSTQSKIWKFLLWGR
jgi:hypothetical protein